MCLQSLYAERSQWMAIVTRYNGHGADMRMMKVQVIGTESMSAQKQSTRGHIEDSYNIISSDLTKQNM